MPIKYCPLLKCKCSLETDTLNQLCMTWWDIFHQPACAINEVMWWSWGERGGRESELEGEGDEGQREVHLL